MHSAIIQLFEVLRKVCYFTRFRYFDSVLILSCGANAPCWTNKVSKLFYGNDYITDHCG